MYFIIKSHEHQEGVAESEKCPKAYFAPTNEIVEYKEKINEATTDGITDKIKKDKGISNDVSLYLNFTKLSPEYKPIVFSLPSYTLMLNDDLPSKEFHIMYFNAFEIKETFSKHNFPMMQAAIQQMFGIQERNSFRLKLDSSSKLYKELPEAVLPFGFDGGSIPSDSLICIDEHEIPETNELTFSCNGRTNTIGLSDTNKPTQDLREEILNELKAYNISQKAVEFKFLNTELNMK
ncbi:hypothetical protein M9Y10_006417 [Tritrichomonas musculus]|uniref:Uncharacterized protein n=1 Tax=Tritrichomonas musculus TaxID=1915356 RepID=A0ABR2JE46_9EUKA